MLVILNRESFSLSHLPGHFEHKVEEFGSLPLNPEQ